MGIVTPASTIAAQTVIVTGSALAWKIQKMDNVAVAFVGEGATSNGVWHEALNFAGIHKLACVFVVQDNLWAESVPKSLGVPVDNLSERAKAYGFPGVTIDGNDLMATYETSRDAVRRARRGDGPTLIDMKTYRWYGHSEIDPANYRTQEELESWKRRDPVPRFERLLMERGVIDEAHKQQTLQRIEREIEEAIEFAERSPHPDPSEVLEDVYAPLG
jgi:TPP-dependent pyruvate/acetoin dehydrogenase alpha subunit